MKVCIFGSASQTLDEIYYTETEKLGHVLAKAGHSLIFGAGRHGMMGAAARGFLAEGAEVIGVAPKFFIPMNVFQENCTQIINHDTMDERKVYMETNSDAFIVTPGGIGTFDELFEVLALINLKQMDKPVIFFNINGFFTPLLNYIEDTVKMGFTSPTITDIYSVTDSAEEVAEILAGYNK